MARFPSAPSSSLRSFASARPPSMEEAMQSESAKARARAAAQPIRVTFERYFSELQRLHRHRGAQPFSEHYEPEPDSPLSPSSVLDDDVDHDDEREREHELNLASESVLGVLSHSTCVPLNSAASSAMARPYPSPPPPSLLSTAAAAAYPHSAPPLMVLPSSFLAAAARARPRTYAEVGSIRVGSLVAAGLNDPSPPLLSPATLAASSFGGDRGTVGGSGDDGATIPGSIGGSGGSKRGSAHATTHAVLRGRTATKLQLQLSAAAKPAITAATATPAVLRVAAMPR